MAQLTFSQQGLFDLAAALKANPLDYPMTNIHLFINDAFPEISTQLADLIECFAAGYAAQAFAGAPTSTQVLADRVLLTFAPVTFTFAAAAFPIPIKGVYITSNGGLYGGGARLNVPYTPPVGGGTLVMPIQIATRNPV